jgi:hypothetical protein
MKKPVLLLVSMALAVILGSGVALSDSPTTKEDCKKGGYAKYGFKNQGQCIKAVNHATPADTTPPDTIIDSGPEGQTGQDNPSWEFHSTKPNSTFECRLLGFDEWHACESPRAYTPEGLPHGEYTFQVRAIDASSNVDPTPAERFVFVDNEGPFAVITSGPGRYTNDATPTFEFHSSDPADTVRFNCRLWIVQEGWTVEENSREYIEPGSPGTDTDSDADPDDCISPHTFPALPDGHYVAEITAEDAVGNTAGNSGGTEYAFTVDTTPPALQEKIAFSTVNEDVTDEALGIMNPDGTGRQLITPDDPTLLGPDSPALSPDGSKIAFAASTDGNVDNDIFVANVDGSNTRPVVTDLTRTWGPTWSPNGNEIAFVCDTTGGGPTSVLLMLIRLMCTGR